jgi:hypothetical protein
MYGGPEVDSAALGRRERWEESGQEEHAGVQERHRAKPKGRLLDQVSRQPV